MILNRDICYCSTLVVICIYHDIPWLTIERGINPGVELCPARTEGANSRREPLHFRFFPLLNTPPDFSPFGATRISSPV